MSQELETPPTNGHNGHNGGGELRRLMPFLPSQTDQIEERFKSTAVRVTVMASSMSIRYKIAAALVGVLVLAVTALGMVSFSSQKKVLEKEMVRRAVVLSRQVAAAGKNGLLTKEDLNVYSTIKDVQKSPDVLYAMVLDSKGRVFAHSALSEKGKTLSGPADKAALEASESLVQHLPHGADVIIDVAEPIEAKLGAKTLRVGTARVGLSQEALTAAIRSQKTSFALVTLTFVLLGLGLSVALGKVLSRRIVVLATGMKVVSQGDFSHLVEVPARDEIGNLAEAFNDMILKLREKLHMEKYLSQSTLQLIKRLRDTEKLKLGGEHRHVTVLFSDIRGFTSMSESLSADEVVDLLNVYLNLQAEVVYQMGGTVNKFVGDEVMAIFTEKDGELQAARAAVEIQRYVKALNEVRASAGKRIAQLGIGLNAGDVVMGNMGSERQMEYTVIGDPINAAARLCSSAAPGQILMSLPVARALGTRASLRLLGPLVVKGKKDPLQVSELIDVPGASRMHMRRQTALPASYVLSGLDDERYVARVNNIGLGGCLIEGTHPLGIGTRIEVTIQEAALSGLGAVPCSVKHLRKAGGRYLMGLAFDELPEETRRHLSEWVHHVETDAVAKTEVVKVETPAPQAPPVEPAATEADPT